MFLDIVLISTIKYNPVKLYNKVNIRRLLQSMAVYVNGVFIIYENLQGNVNSLRRLYQSLTNPTLELRSDLLHRTRIIESLLLPFTPAEISR